ECDDWGDCEEGDPDKDEVDARDSYGFTTTLYRCSRPMVTYITGLSARSHKNPLGVLVWPRTLWPIAANAVTQNVGFRRQLVEKHVVNQSPHRLTITTILPSNN
ncbi:MAG: hypothetical protein V3S33_06505, partial [Gammaproteobacteria bacterium]